ncbi:MAG: hypothetical protein JXB48_08605 [Candidatus Latescibacteria bacterium]|nr:hypothetical protein [Candidatus Latescibacterota bacterium]
MSATRMSFNQDYLKKLAFRQVVGALREVPLLCYVPILSLLKSPERARLFRKRSAACLSRLSPGEGGEFCGSRKNAVNEEKGFSRGCISLLLSFCRKRK